MTRSLFDEVTLDQINEGLNNIIKLVKETAEAHSIKVEDSEIRKLIELANKIAIENEG